jgi:hypothetical protein
VLLRLKNEVVDTNDFDQINEKLKEQENIFLNAATAAGVNLTAVRKQITDANTAVTNAARAAEKARAVETARAAEEQARRKAEEQARHKAEEKTANNAYNSKVNDIIQNSKIVQSATVWTSSLNTMTTKLAEDLVKLQTERAHIKATFGRNIVVDNGYDNASSEVSIALEKAAKLKQEVKQQKNARSQVIQSAMSETKAAALDLPDIEPSAQTEEELTVSDIVDEPAARAVAKVKVLIGCDSSSVAWTETIRKLIKYHGFDQAAQITYISAKTTPEQKFFVSLMNNTPDKSYDLVFITNCGDEEAVKSKLSDGQNFKWATSESAKRLAAHIALGQSWLKSGGTLYAGGFSSKILPGNITTELKKRFDAHNVETESIKPLIRVGPAPSITFPSQKVLSSIDVQVPERKSADTFKKFIGNAPVSEVERIAVKHLMAGEDDKVLLKLVQTDKKTKQKYEVQVHGSIVECNRDPACSAIYDTSKRSGNTRTIVLGESGIAPNVMEIIKVLFETRRVLRVRFGQGANVMMANLFQRVLVNLRSFTRPTQVIELIDFIKEFNTDVGSNIEDHNTFVDLMNLKAL